MTVRHNFLYGYAVNAYSKLNATQHFIIVQITSTLPGLPTSLLPLSYSPFDAGLLLFRCALVTVRMSQWSKVEGSQNFYTSGTALEVLTVPLGMNDCHVLMTCNWGDLKTSTSKQTTQRRKNNRKSWQVAQTTLSCLLLLTLRAEDDIIRHINDCYCHVVPLFTNQCLSWMKKIHTGRWCCCKLSCLYDCTKSACCLT